LQKMRFA